MFRSTLPRPRLFCLLAVVMSLAALPAALRAQPANAPMAERDGVAVGRTLEVTPGYPRIHVQLQRDGEVLTGEPLTFGALQSLQNIEGLDGLEDIDQMLQEAQGPARSFQAFLDTGASAYVISKTTAERFGLEREQGAVYHEVGLHGETPMHVSTPYTVALAGSTGKLMDDAGAFQVIDRDARLQLSPQAPQNPTIELAMGAIDVVGMPAIRHHVVEINPAPLGGLNQAMQGLGDLANMQDLADLQNGDFLDQIGEVGTGPAVTLHADDYEPTDIDLVVPLEYRDFTRHHNPRDRGSHPTLAPNPMLRVDTQHGERHFTGDWLLDTGAPASIISTEHAIALGLYDENGQPTQQPHFELPLGGIAGDIQRVPGYRVDALHVPTRDGRAILYHDVSVLVTDISIEMDTGETITLDGVFGTNLLMPTVAGMGLGLPTDMAPAPYRRVWIDGPGQRLLLELPEEQEP